MSQHCGTGRGITVDFKIFKDRSSLRIRLRMVKMWDFCIDSQSDRQDGPVGMEEWSIYTIHILGMVEWSIPERFLFN